MHSNFGNVLNVKLSELPLGVCDDYKESKDSTLIEIIDRPVWHKTSDNISDGKSDTLRPDLISIYECGDSGEYVLAYMMQNIIILIFTRIRQNTKL